MQNIMSFIHSGGFIMYPLLVCSILVWGVIFERFFRYHKLGAQLQSFHMEAMNAVLRNDWQKLKTLAEQMKQVPEARAIQVALDRLSSSDERMRSKWVESIERARQMENHGLRKNLWILGSIATAAPFIGLFGTVVGILRSFQDMAKTGSGGFAIVAAGISEALIATAAGIIVAVIASLAFNTFQTRCASLVLQVKLQLEEWIELVGQTDFGKIK